MEARSIDADGIFKVFTACPNDPKTLIFDVRPHKDFKKKHINQAYCVRVSSNRQVLADYSQSSYSLPWSQHCWWGKPVIVYGPAGVSKDHDVVKYLTAEGRCTSVHYFKPGFEAFEAKFPFLCTPSVKANSIKKYPSMILPGFLYLGDWADAQQHDRLKEIGLKRLVTVHNHPDRLAVMPGVQHLKIELADVEGADISPHFNVVYEFIADAERLKQPVLVHCGAGVSRSACLVMMYLMRSRLWSAQKSRDYCIAARSLVCPNDGFWRVLCALEGPLGVLDRSDPEATMGFAGADAPAKLDQQAAGLPVTVKMITAAELKKQQQQEQEAAAAAVAEAAEEQRRREAEATATAALAEAGPIPQLRRGRSRSTSRSTGSTSSSSSSGSDSSSGTSSSSSSSSSDEEDRSRSRSIDRNKKRHRSSSRDRAHAAVQASRATAGEYRSRRGHSRSKSRSRSRDRNRRNRNRSRSRDRHGRRQQHRSRSRDQRERNAAHRAEGNRTGGSSRGGDMHRDRGMSDRSAQQLPPPPAAPAVQPSAAAGPSQSGWLVTLEVSKPEGLVGRLVLGPMSIHQRVIFGRAPSCNVVMEHLSVSRQHAQLFVDLSGTVNVMDMGAAHGTKLNDTWIKAQQPRAMPVGSKLKFGASTRVYTVLSVEKV